MTLAIAPISPVHKATNLPSRTPNTQIQNTIVDMVLRTLTDPSEAGRKDLIASLQKAQYDPASTLAKILQDLVNGTLTNRQIIEKYSPKKH